MIYYCCKCKSVLTDIQSQGFCVKGLCPIHGVQFAIVNNSEESDDDDSDRSEIRAR